MACTSMDGWQHTLIQKGKTRREGDLPPGGSALPAASTYHPSFCGLFWAFSVCDMVGSIYSVRCCGVAFVLSVTILSLLPAFSVCMRMVNDTLYTAIIAFLLVV